MDSSKLSALLLAIMLTISSSLHTAIGCAVCPTPKSPGPSHKKGTPITVPPVIVNPPVGLPPIIGKPPVTLPPIIGKPPVTLPPIIGKPPVTLPPIIGKPPITLPPIIENPPIIGNPPVTLPPIIGKPPVTEPPVTRTPACPSPPAVKKTCPVDALKLGGCLDLLGNVVQIGDPAVSQCCPLINGLAGIEAAACLCTTIKAKLLDLNLFLPIAMNLLISCGKTPPPGYTCP